MTFPTALLPSNPRYERQFKEGVGRHGGEGDEHPARGLLHPVDREVGLVEQKMKREEVHEYGKTIIQPEDVGLMVWDAVNKPER